MPGCALKLPRIPFLFPAAVVCLKGFFQYLICNAVRLASHRASLAQLKDRIQQRQAHARTSGNNVVNLLLADGKGRPRTAFHLQELSALIAVWQFYLYPAVKSSYKSRIEAGRSVSCYVKIGGRKYKD